MRFFEVGSIWQADEELVKNLGKGQYGDGNVLSKVKAKPKHYKAMHWKDVPALLCGFEDAQRNREQSPGITDEITRCIQPVCVTYTRKI